MSRKISRLAASAALALAAMSATVLPASANEVLDTCYGAYGTCPRTALDGLRRLMSVDIDDVTPESGQTIIPSRHRHPDLHGLASTASWRSAPLGLTHERPLLSRPGGAGVTGG